MTERDETPFLTTLGGTVSMTFVNAAMERDEAYRLLLGLDPSTIEPAPPPVYSVSWTKVAPPIDPPRKRRGLTGKRYRIARRRYSRTMRAFERGLIPGREFHYFMPHVVHDVQRVPGRPDEFSVGFRGVSPDFTVLDEASGWRDLGYTQGDA